MTTEREYVVLTLEDHKPSRDGTMCVICCVNNPPDTMSWWSEPWPCPTLRLAAAEQQKRELVAAIRETICDLYAEGASRADRMDAAVKRMRAAVLANRAVLARAGGDAGEVSGGANSP